MLPKVDHLARAYELLRLERYDLALAEAGQALAVEPQSAEAHVCAAWALRDLGRMGEAEDAARAALAASPQSPAAHNVLACVLWRAGRRAAAEDAFQSMLTCPPPVPPEFLTNYARFLVTMGRAEKALAVVGQALAASPTLAIAHEVRGHALAALGRRDEAGTAYRAALQVDPRNFQAHNRLGEIYLATGETPAALDSFREALRLRPGDAGARTNLVTALKARHPLYGGVLRQILRLRSTRVPRYLTAAAAVLFFGPALVASIGGEGSALDHAMFSLWAVGVFVLLGVGLLGLVWTGVIDPLFNTLLLFDPQGRQAIEYSLADGVHMGALAVLLLSGLGLCGTVLLIDADHPAVAVFAGLTVAALAGLLMPTARPTRRSPWRQVTWIGYGGAVLGLGLMVTGFTLDTVWLIAPGIAAGYLGLIGYLLGLGIGRRRR